MKTFKVYHDSCFLTKWKKSSYYRNYASKLREELEEFLKLPIVRVECKPIKHIRGAVCTEYYIVTLDNEDALTAAFLLAGKLGNPDPYFEEGGWIRPKKIGRKPRHLCKN